MCQNNLVLVKRAYKTTTATTTTAISAIGRDNVKRYLNGQRVFHLNVMRHSHFIYTVYLQLVRWLNKNIYSDLLFT